MIRLKAPQTGETVVEDQVQGRRRVAEREPRRFRPAALDGTPTYMLAVVVDDHDMGITHIIRGDDHLTNAARQTQIYQALGWDVPVMAHIPLIHGPDGAKLSKRHGALGVDAYRAMGYLPEAMRNYLRPARLEPWRRGDLFDERDDRVFDLAAFGRSPARFDFAKLENLNGHYIRARPTPTCGALEVVLPHLADGQSSASKIDAAMRGKCSRPCRAEGTRQDAGRTIRRRRFLCADRPLDLDDKAEALLTPEAARPARRSCCRSSVASTDWTARRDRSRGARSMPKRAGLKLGEWRSRCGRRSPGARFRRGIFEVLAVLGKDETLAGSAIMRRP